MIKGTRLSILICAMAVAASGTAYSASPNGMIGAALVNTKGEWYSAELYGILDEAKKFGYDVNVQDAGGYGNIDKGVSQISNLIVQKVKAIIADSADPAAYNGVMRQAKAAHIPTISAGNPIIASDVPPDAAASSSHCMTGSELAVGAKKLLPNGGTVAILAGPPGAYWATERVKCFKQGIAGTSLKIVAEQTSEQDMAVALNLAGDFLQRFPNVSLLYSADDTYGVGAARAVQAAGKCGKVKVLFAVFGPAAEEMMKAGCVDYVVALQPALMGRIEVRLANDLITGKKLKERIVQVPVVVVTPANYTTVDRSGMQPPKGWTP
jgi:ABC-type sugar transport system substrate-binding protein